MSISDVPLGFQQGTLVVNGTNSDWIKPIEDCIYDYFVDKWAVQTRTVTDTQTEPFKWRSENINYDNQGTKHFWIDRKETERVQEDDSGQLWRCDCRFQINVLVKRGQKSQVKAGNDLDTMLRELNRLMIEYSSHWIAGIHFFNNIVEIPLIWHPDDDKNPFQGCWVAGIIAHAYYYLSTRFYNDSIPYNPATVSAGVLTYNV